MAGTVVLDDVELREAQRDYLDFLDDEVREARGRETLALEGPGDADGPREATADAAPRRAGVGRGTPGTSVGPPDSCGGAGALRSLPSRVA